MPRVLMSSTEGRNGLIADGLRQNGIEVLTLPPSAAMPGSPRYPTEVEIAEYWRLADGFLLTGQDMVTRQAMEGAPNLKVGASWIIGTENIDVEAATDLGIPIAFGNTPENSAGVAEAVAMLIPALLKRLPAKWQVMRDGGFRVEDVGRMVRGRTIGLIGLGAVGRGVARRLTGWEVNLIASDPYVDQGIAEQMGVRLVELDDLLKQADIVSIMVVLTDETRHLIGAQQLALMKPDAFLVNTARGSCVDEAALLKALEAGQIAGAAIDVWEQEPTPRDNPLRRHPKVIATGHNVAHSTELFDGLIPAAVENLTRGLRGEPPLYLRNPEVLPKWRERLQHLNASIAAS